MLQGAHNLAHDRGLNLWQVINQAEAYQFKMRGRPPKIKPVAVRRTEAREPKLVEDGDKLTPADMETLRQARAMFE